MTAILLILALPLWAGNPPKNALPFTAREVVIPFYLGEERQPSLVVKLDHLSNERQRKGFFRIGVLPLLVAHGVEIEVRTPENFSAVRQQFHEHLAGRELKNAVELRGFTLTIPRSQTTLTAQKVRLLSADAWELNGDVRLVTATATNTFSKATLITSGASAGILRGERNRTYNLFTKPTPAN